MSIQLLGYVHMLNDLVKLNAPFAVQWYSKLRDEQME